MHTKLIRNCYILTSAGRKLSHFGEKCVVLFEFDFGDMQAFNFSSSEFILTLVFCDASSLGFDISCHWPL